jgi:DNA-binding protein HU-beta
VNKRELVAELSERWEVSKADATAMLDTFQAVVTETVCKGEDVTITGFCKFARKDMPSRMGRNPATGETIKIKASRKVRITPLKTFKDAVMASKKGSKKK